MELKITMLAVRKQGTRRVDSQKALSVSIRNCEAVCFVEVMENVNRGVSIRSSVTGGNAGLRIAIFSRLDLASAVCFVGVRQNLNRGFAIRNFEEIVRGLQPVGSKRVGETPFGPLGKPALRNGSVARNWVQALGRDLPFGRIEKPAWSDARLLMESI